VLPTPAGGGFGLFSLRERLRSVGGSVTVKSAPGEGCRVEIRFPAVTGTT